MNPFNSPPSASNPPPFAQGNQNQTKAFEAKVMGSGDPDNIVDRMKNLPAYATAGGIHQSKNGSQYVHGAIDAENLNAEDKLGRKLR